MDGVGDVGRRAPTAEHALADRPLLPDVASPFAPRRANPAGRHAVDADLRRQRFRETLREGHHSPLRGSKQFAAVSLHAGGRLIPADRHDRAPLAITHPSAKAPREQHRGDDVDPQQLVELLLEAPTRGRAGEHVGPGHEHQRVELRQASADVGDQLLDGDSVGEIGEKRAGMAVGLGQHRRHFVGSLTRTAVHGHTGAGRSQRHRHLAADAVG